MTGELVVITGGAAGIGRAVAMAAASTGASLALLDLDADKVRAAAEAAEGAGATEAIGWQCDVTDADEVDQVVGAAVAAMGPPAGLVSAAGIDRGGPVHSMEPDTWRQVIEVNLTGSFLVARAVIRHMISARNPGSIVLCSSPAAQVGFAAGGANAYAASKGGVSALVRTMAVDYAAHGIRVNAIVPGATETELMWATVPPRRRAEMRAKVCAEVPLGRLADPSELARAALWLLGPDSSYVTGSHLVCDGGILAKASISV